MSLLEAKRALSDAVLDVCSDNGIQVVRENSQRPDGNQLPYGQGAVKWARQFQRENVPQPFTLGAGGADKATGFYQLDILYPAGTGTADADVDLELFRAALNRKTFTHNSQWVKVMSVGAPRRYFEDETWYVMNINVNWEALVPA